MAAPNFKPPPPIRDESHLANLRECCCVICQTTLNVEPHHLLRTPEKAMGRRSGDNWAIPLCGGLDGHHRGSESVHANGDETAWFNAFGIDPQQLAADFWAMRGSLWNMQRLASTTAAKVRCGR